MALAQYREKFWFPNGALATNITARVFLHDNNVFATLYTDATGTTTKPNPTRTDGSAYLDFWAEEGSYWIHIDSESFEVSLGSSGEGATQGYVLARIAEHNADTTAVHGIADTALLETQAGAQAKATAARNEAQATASADATAKANEAREEAEETAAAALALHAADTTSVHGIPDTSLLLTDADIANLATDAELAAVAADLTATDAQLTAHEAATTNVHGIPDTADIPSGAQLDQVQAQLDAHQDATTEVHGISDTSELETQSGAAAKVAAHSADTTAVHGIPDTALLLTDADIAGLATEAQVEAVADDLAAHEADTTSVHGIADTALLETQAGAQTKADAARDAAVATAAADATTKANAAQAAAEATAAGALAGHAADTTSVHGIPDTSLLLTDADLAGYATDAELAAHEADTTSVHGIANTALLETQSGAQAKADAAEAAAEATAAGALAAHEADTTSVHGIPDTSVLVTDSDLAAYATDADLAAHEADTTAVHGIANTAVLETQAGAQAKADAAEADAAADATAKVAAHEADTTSVHGIANTALLETTSGAQAKADAAQAAAIADAATKYLNRLTGGTVTGTITALNASPTAVAYAAQVTAEAFDRFRILHNGQHEWGSGAAGREILLYRSATGVLTLVGTLRAILAASATLGYGVSVTGDTNDRFTISAAGVVSWGPGNGAADIALRRASAGLLQLDNNLAVLGTTALTGQLSVANQLAQTRASASDAVRDVRVTGDTQPRFYQTASGQIYWGPGNAAVDTTLYRDAVGSLVTDGDFTINGILYGGDTVSTATGVTAPAGFTVSQQEMRVKNGWKFVVIGIASTAGITTPGGSSGNVTPDLTICTLPADYRPPLNVPVAVTTGVSDGVARVNSTGDVELQTWTPNQSIAAAAILRFYFVAPV